jgi:hypothetical protein
MFFVKRNREPTSTSLQVKRPPVFDNNDDREDILEAHQPNLVLY